MDRQSAERLQVGAANLVVRDVVGDSSEDHAEL